MTWRSVLVYWVSALVVGTYLYSGWRAQQPAEELLERPRASIVSVTAGDVDGVRAHRGALTIELVRERSQAQPPGGGSRWRVASPAGLNVSSDLVDALIDTLTTIPPVEILTEGAAAVGAALAGDDGLSDTVRLERFGLAAPVYRIDLRVGDKELATVELGNRNPTRTAVYARLSGQDDLYLIGLNAQYYVELMYEQIEKQAPARGRR